MDAPLDPARRHRPDRLDALQRLDLGLVVHTQHDGVRRWVQVQPDHVADLGLQLRIGGELERLGLPWLDVVLGPDPGDRAVADTQLAGQQPRGPVGHAEVLRWGGQRRGQDLGPPVTAQSLGAATAGSVGQPPGEPLPHIAVAPGDHGRASDPKPLGDLAVGHALGGQQQDPGPLDLHGWRLGSSRPAAEDGQVLGCYRKGSGGQRHAGMLSLHHPTVKSTQIRSTSASCVSPCQVVRRLFAACPARMLLSGCRLVPDPVGSGLALSRCCLLRP
jgi:hypothetical protein